jgi:ribose-phosphate pyrophosphokinase
MVLALPGNEALGAALARLTGAETGTLLVRQFPDGETLVQVGSDVQGAEVIVAATLHQPDRVMMPLYFLASTLRELGAARIVLVAPYLAYMRQDKPFHSGEGTTARHFARWLSSFLDGLITVDPHLHRIHELGEVYTIPTLVVPAAPVISAWLREHLPASVLIGPDAESLQWVSEVAMAAGCPFTVLEKTRRGDNDVSVTVPQIERWRQLTPVLMDDIISTGHTMAAAAEQLQKEGMPAPVCIGVHAVFAGAAAALLQETGVSRLLTCNTIAHPSNGIDLYPALADAVRKMLAKPLLAPCG